MSNINGKDYLFQDIKPSDLWTENEKPEEFSDEEHWARFVNKFSPFFDIERKILSNTQARKFLFTKNSFEWKKDLVEIQIKKKNIYNIVSYKYNDSDKNIMTLDLTWKKLNGIDIGYGSVALKEISPGMLKTKMYQKEGLNIFPAFNYCDVENNLFDQKLNNTSFNLKLRELTWYKEGKNNTTEFSLSEDNAKDTRYYTIPKICFSQNNQTYNIQGWFNSPLNQKEQIFKYDPLIGEFSQLGGQQIPTRAIPVQLVWTNVNHEIVNANYISFISQPEGMCLYVNNEKKYCLQKDEVFQLAVRTPIKAQLTLEFKNEKNDKPVEGQFLPIKIKAYMKDINLPHFATKWIYNNNIDYHFSTFDNFNDLGLTEGTLDTIKPDYFSPFLINFFSGASNSSGTIKWETREGTERHPFYFYTPTESSYITKGTMLFHHVFENSNNIQVSRKELLFSKTESVQDFSSKNTKFETNIVFPNLQKNNFLRIDPSSVYLDGNPAASDGIVKYEDPTSNSPIVKATFEQYMGWAWILEYLDEKGWGERNDDWKWPDGTKGDTHYHPFMCAGNQLGSSISYTQLKLDSEGNRYVDAYLHQNADPKTRTKLRCVLKNMQEYKEELQIEITVLKINLQTQ